MSVADGGVIGVFWYYDDEITGNLYSRFHSIQVVGDLLFPALVCSYLVRSVTRTRLLPRSAEFSRWSRLVRPSFPFEHSFLTLTCIGYAFDSDDEGWIAGSISNRYTESSF